MILKKGKVFQNIVSKKVESILYESTSSYYEFIKSAQIKGYKQNIITSDIMIKILENFLFSYNVTINEIIFLEEDYELESEIKNLINKININSLYWIQLKERLLFLSNTDSIDIKKISFRCNTEKYQFLVDVFINGLFSVNSKYDDRYDIVKAKIEKLVEENVK